ncbi:MAG: dUTP diphosphatase [Brevinematales bacterium]|nr:dUTP diphosphatase [Brevinematales bacterium]
MIELKVKILRKNSTLPKYQTESSAGLDLYACIDEDIVINPGEIKSIPTGISIELPDGYEAQIRPRSGLALNYGLTLPNTPGTIDPDYRGEIIVILMNLGKEPFIVKNGMRIAQMVISKFERVSIKVVDELSQTSRGTGGFGSTGI